MTDELLKWRDEFPILGNTTYLISHSLGAMPRRVYERMNEYADTWATRGIRAWAEGWWEMPLAVGDVLAPIIGAPPETVAMHQNVSVCQSLILSCFPPKGKRNKIVYSSLEFPSVTYVYEAHARDGSYRIVTVPSDDGIRVSNERLLEAIDEETLLVPISHVLFKSAFLQDAKAITERAHEVGAIVVLDTYQSAGTVPFSVTDLDVDFATGGSVKWLCGGAGAGYLYVHPRWHEQLEPKVTGWMAHEQPFAFEAGAIKYASGIARFLHGSPAIPTLYAARSGYEIINEIGIQNIRAKNQRQTTKLIEIAEDAGFNVTSPKDVNQRGGTITVNAPHAASVVKALAEENILVDFRPGAGVRISPHFYTSDEELTRIIESMKRIVETKSFAQHDAAAAY